MASKTLAGRVGLFVICVTLLLVACSTTSSLTGATDQPDTDSSVASEPPVTSTPGSNGPRPTAVPPELATPYVPAGPVGDADAYRAHIDAMIELLDDGTDPDDVPWPDLRQPDPADAFAEIQLFVGWMIDTSPDPGLVDTWAHADSPEQRDRRVAMASNRDWVLAPDSRSDYEAFPQVTLFPTDFGLDPDELPEGAVAHIYEDVQGARTFVNTETGEVSFQAARPRLGPWLAIMVPTDVGWLIWSDDLLDEPIPDWADPLEQQPDGRRTDLDV